MNEEQIAAQLAANETEHRSFRRRLDEHDAMLREQGKIFVALEKQSSAIQAMNNSMARVEKKVDGIGSRVDELEKEPGERWKKLVWEVIKYVALALLGLGAGMIIKGA